MPLEPLPQRIFDRPQTWGRKSDLGFQFLGKKKLTFLILETDMGGANAHITPLSTNDDDDDGKRSSAMATLPSESAPAEGTGCPSSSTSRLPDDPVEEGKPAEAVSQSAGSAAGRDAKKRRLRELRAAHECVRTIVNHMGKHYRHAAPPPWLDLRAVAGQLARSRGVACQHAAWRNLRESLAEIGDWMANRRSWREAVQGRKMPHIGTRSEIVAVGFLHGGSPGVLPKPLMKGLRAAQLEFLLDEEPRGPDAVPHFWRDAELDDPQWRSTYMERKHSTPHLPFDDDLTDLVLSVVCKKRSSVAGGGGAGAADKEMSEISDNGAGAEERVKAESNSTSPDRGPDRWEDEVQATVSRIAETVNETVATSVSQLLGKRYRQEEEEEEEEEDGAEDGRGKKKKKTHKTTTISARAAGSQQPIDSVEDSGGDDNHSLAPSSRKGSAGDRSAIKRLRAKYSALKERDDQLLSLCGTLEEDSRSVKREMEHLATECAALRKSSSSGEDKQQQLAEKCGALEGQINRLVEENQRLSAQVAALTDSVRNLEEQSTQRTARCSTLEDENRDLREQVTAMATRIEALEQALKAAQSKAESSRLAGPEFAGTAETEGFDDSCKGKTHLQQPTVKTEGVSAKMTGLGGYDSRRVATPFAQSPPPPAQPGYATADQRTASVPPAQIDERPQFPENLTRSLTPSVWTTHRPRVPQMPTADPDAHRYPRQGGFNHTIAGYTYPSRLKTYPNSAMVTPEPPAPFHARAHPAAEITPPASNPSPTDFFSYRRQTTPSTANTIATTTPTGKPQTPATPRLSQTPTTTTDQHQCRHQCQTQNKTGSQNQHTNHNNDDNNKKNNSDDHPAILAHLSWIPKPQRDALISFVAQRLDREAWERSTDEMVARCRASGLQFGQLRELIECLRRALREMEEGEKEDGEREGEGEGDEKGEEGQEEGGCEEEQWERGEWRQQQQQPQYQADYYVYHHYHHGSGRRWRGEGMGRF